MGAAVCAACFNAGPYDLKMLSTPCRNAAEVGPANERGNAQFGGQEPAGHAQVDHAQEISSSATERRKSETQADLEESNDNLKVDNDELQVSKMTNSPSHLPQKFFKKFLLEFF